MGETPNLKLPFPDEDDAPDGATQVRDLAVALDGGTPGAQGIWIVGEVRFLPILAVPAGWLLCDGAAVSRTAYAALFAALGEAFGAGDGSTTFNLPPIAGRAVVGSGSGAGLTPRAVGTRWGVEAVLLGTAQVPQHNHYGVTPDHLHSVGSLYTGNHAHGASASGSTAGDSSVQSLAGGPLLLARGGHTHNIGVDAVGNIGIGGATGASDRSLAFYTQGMNVTAPSTAHDNTQPSIAIPAYIYAGA